MGQSGSHQAKRSPASDAIELGAASLTRGLKCPSASPDALRIADLEAQLALATQALQTERCRYDEDLATFEKALSRVAQSERSLSQTKARLVDAETLARAEQARAEALSAELTAVRATAATDVAQARENATAAEAREQQALAAARNARFELAANVAELEELQGKVSDLRDEHAANHDELTAELALCDAELKEAIAHNQRLKSDLVDCQAELAAAAERNDVLTHERTRLLGLLASLEVLAREVTHLTAQAATATGNLPKVETWLGRDVEAEHVRATVRPEPMSAPAPVASAPEITVDGVKLES